MKSDLEIIDAFIDGERVDAGALKNALADPDGRAYLIDAWLLREAVREREGEAPSTIPVIPATPSSRPGRRWLVAAAIAGSLVGGYALGNLTVTRPPSPVASTPMVTAGTQPQQAYPVPAATRIIQLEFHNPPSTNGGG